MVMMIPVVATNGGYEALGGSLVGTGLLGAVLAWLMFWHLPAKDQLLKEFMTNKDKQLSDMLGKGAETISEVTKSIEANLQSITNHCKDEMAQITGIFQREIDRVHSMWESGIRAIESRDQHSKKTLADGESKK